MLLSAKHFPLHFLLALAAMLLSMSSAPAADGDSAATFSDPFTIEAEVPERRAMRGEWQIAQGSAQVAQDDELYKKFKDHGPILFYDVASTDATFRYAFKPDAACKSVVFTLNAESGHVFRYVTSANGTSVRAFPPGAEKSIETHKAPEWKLAADEWTNVEVTVAGEKVTVKFGEHEPVSVEHPSYATARSNFSVGFSFGGLAVKDLTMTGLSAASSR